ncbi:Zn-ribbon domain-containing OB-fold protein [Pseudofrankia asymbiotica]|uniref:DNA-binding protein n=1 Tax=Pseudofrankia asymbiotica TaxID=1834516 RepID=A0A1V2I0H6_9ACTN|nr:OB-fold domain-containing protein [Pseudofrankia asymbiotica]ONH22882.1 hypothetical protein BL253_34450 [Pseudofrankia asymbiotica]
MSYDKPLPDVDDPLTRPFWQGLRERRLTIQRCGRCGALRWPAAPICPECLAPGAEWTDVAADGELWSYVVYRRALSPAFADEIPYAVGVVALDAGPHLLSRISGPVDTLKVGARMTARYEDVSPTVTLLRWVTESPGPENGGGSSGDHND